MGLRRYCQGQWQVGCCIDRGFVLGLGVPTFSSELAPCHVLTEVSSSWWRRFSPSMVLGVLLRLTSLLRRVLGSARGLRSLLSAGEGWCSSAQRSHCCSLLLPLQRPDMQGGEPLDYSDMEGLLPADGELGIQGRGLIRLRPCLGSSGLIPSTAGLSNPPGQLLSPCYNLPLAADVSHRRRAKGHVTTGLWVWELDTQSFHS